MKGLAGRALVLVATLLFGVTLAQAAPHPMDPLTAEEILGVASILLAGGAAQPGAIFQAIDLREPGKDAVLGFPGGGNPPRRATVFFRQSKKSYRSVVNLTTGTFTPPAEIPRTEGQLGLTFQEIVDFAFVFQDPSFLRALARRGIDTPEELARVLVTPLTPGSFGLPEERRRIVKAQMYSTAGPGSICSPSPSRAYRPSSIWTSARSPR